MVHLPIRRPAITGSGGVVRWRHRAAAVVAVVLVVAVVAAVAAVAVVGTLFTPQTV